MRIEEPSFPDFNHGRLSIRREPIVIPAHFTGVGELAVERDIEHYRMVFDDDTLASFSVDSTDAILASLQSLAQLLWHDKLQEILRLCTQSVDQPSIYQEARAFIDEQVFKLNNPYEQADYKSKVSDGDCTFSSIHVQDDENPSRERGISIQKGHGSTVELALSQPRGAMWSENILAAMFPSSRMDISTLIATSQQLTKLSR